MQWVSVTGGHLSENPREKIGVDPSVSRKKSMQQIIGADRRPRKGSPPGSLVGVIFLSFDSLQFKENLIKTEI